MKAPRRPATGNSRTRLWIGAGLALALVATLGVLAIAQSTGDDGSGDRPRAGHSAASATSGQSDQNDQNGALTRLAHRKPDDPLSMGRVDAPVVMVEWAEFQCPFCGQFARDTQPELVKKYVDSGKVRIEWRDFPYLGKQSTTAAHAGRAAAAQGRFWEYHDALFAHQVPVNSGELDEEHLVHVAGTLGMDTGKFRDDMNSQQVADAVEHDRQEALGLGITGTPAFVIGDQPLIGSMSTDTFERAIDKQLRKAG